MNQMIRYSEMPPIDHTGQLAAPAQRPVQMAHVATNTPTPVSAGPKRRGPKVGSRRGRAAEAAMAPQAPPGDPYAFHSEAPNGIAPHWAARQLFQTPATGRQPHTQQQQHEQQSATGHLREASRLAAAAEAANLRQVPKGAEESQQVGARMLAHKPAGPQTQMSLAGGGGGGGGGGGAAMQQPPPPLASSSNARLSNTSEPPVSYYPQHQHQQHHQQQPQSQHYQVEQHPNEMAPHLGLMGARRTGQPQGQVMYAAQTNATQLPYTPAGGFSSGAADTPLVPQGARNARQQSPYLQQQQQQQQIPVRHNQQQQQQLVSEPNTMLPHQQQRGYARPAPNQALANNFNPSVNIPTQVQQVQQPHQQPLVGGPSGDLMAPGSDSFAQSSAPLLQQQLNRQRPPTQLQHEPQHYQLDVPIQQAQAQPQAQPHQQHQQHASFAYQQQQAARPLTGHKQRPMQPGGGPHRPPQQRQQVSASAQLQQHQLDVQPQQFPCNPTPPLTPNRLAGGPPASLKQQPPPHPHPHPDDWSLGYPQQQQPVNGVASYHQEAQPSHQIKQRIHQMPKSQPPANTLQYHPTGQPGQFIAQPLEPQAAPVISQKPAPASAEQQIRLTLPLRDGALVGPFKLEHELQFATKSFHLRPQLFEQLSKAALQHHHQTAAVIQELQFRAYLSTEVATQTAANSLLAANQHNNNHNHHYHHQHQRQAHTNNCQWPEMFQVSCNQQLVHLDRSTTAGSGAGAGRLAHRAVDLFPYCQPGDNLLELQLHGCYCSHEYVLELVDRPTLKAFTNSCFKTRVLSSDACLAKLSSCFGKPSFACQLPAAGIINEYLTEYLVQPNGQQVEQTRLKISLRCPLSGRRMRTPTRGPNCTHLQCFDLESFLMANRERTRWSCPICALPVPFNMLELDQHQIGICQSMAGVARTDEVLVNSLGQWQAYQPGSPPLASQVPMYQHQASSKANGLTFHQQPNVGVPMRPARGAGPPTHWDQQQQQQQPPPQLQQSASPPTGGPVRRPPSSMGAHQTASKAKRPLNTNPNNNSTPPYQSPGPLAQTVAAQQQTNFLLESPLGQSQAPDAELSPLAAMERTIIHHEQQMGPPPFDANILTASSSPLRSGAPTPSAGAAHSSPSSANNATPSFASPQHHHQHHQPSPPDSSQLMGQQQAVGSPARHVVVASPQQQPARLAQSPLQQSGASHNQQSNSTPATPLLHAAPETPATPGQPGSMQPQSSAQQQLGQQQQQQQNVDHQPLSNGSASAASITSTSTLTPSGQSLGSVGMGGDSRCNTAPLQNALGSLDDLVQVANSAGQLMNSSSPYSNKQQMAPVNPLQLHHHQLDGSLAQSSGPFGGHHLDQADKGDILMSTLMMEAAGESGQPSELALALEEAEWKQQLDRGKSQHLANFLNEPLMNKQQLHQQQNQHPFAGPASEHHTMEKAAGLDGANKMLSNSLSHSDDEGLNQLSPGRGFGAMDSPSSELLAEQLHQQHQHPLDSYANYLDSNAADDGAGLPPDDSILDLFER